MDKKYQEVSIAECRVQGRYCFSIRYIQSAALFCRLGYEIEKKFLNTNKISPDVRIRHFAFVSNTIFSSVSFLEATINELFSNAADDQIWDIHANKETIELFGKLWELDIPRTAHYPILKKYQIALSLAGKSLFDKGVPPYQNVHNIIQLRNYLMHYEPEWIEIQSGRGQEKTANEHKFNKIFRGKFKENPLANNSEPFFPDKCIGHGCAEWAVKNICAFTDEFFQKIEMSAPYDMIKKELSLK